jgi:hypothetical protein
MKPSRTAEITDLAMKLRSQPIRPKAEACGSG